MEHLDQLRNALPDTARDIKLNLQSVLQPGTLSAEQTWGTAVATAMATRHPDLVEAVVADARAHASDATIQDAQAAAVLMGMNNVYYRFRHVVGKETYSQKPARLRMGWIGKPAGSKADFELFCLAVSTINNCEACVRSHESAILENGLTDEHVHDAVRIAAVMNAAAVAIG